MRAYQSQRPGLDQSTLSRQIHIDTSTIAGVLSRLEARGLNWDLAAPSEPGLAVKQRVNWCARLVVFSL